MLKDNVSIFVSLGALAVMLLVVVILALHGMSEDATLLSQLVTGAVGIAGAIAGLSQQSKEKNDPNGQVVKKD